jgi:hypothetical protein
MRKNRHECFPDLHMCTYAACEMCPAVYCMCVECKKWRIQNSPSFVRAAEGLTFVADRLKGKTVYERIAHYRTEVRSLMNNCQKRNDGDLLISWQIGDTDKRMRCCKWAFASAHDISTRALDIYVKEIVEGVEHRERPLNVQTHFTPKEVQNVNNGATAYCIELSHDNLALLNCPSNPAAMAAVTWMEEEFNLRADCTPNKLGKQQLEPVNKNAIYEEYEKDMLALDPTTNIVSLQAFLYIWATRFPYVTIAHRKTVTGKCQVCAALLEAKCKYGDAARRSMIKQLFGMHKITFMSERQHYYRRRLHAMRYPKEAVSIISDGMDQNHCRLPWKAGRCEYKTPLNIHIQGVIVHGLRRVVYRSFANVPKNSNLAIHCWLLELEKIYKDNGNKLPDLIFKQIDGGAENRNSLFLAMAELMIARRLTKRIEICRLLVGHTHEDIDAMFGVISQFLAGKFVGTPQEHMQGMRAAFGAAGLPVEVFDIWAVPDYKELLSPFIDKSFKRYSTEEWTQLVFIFEAVDPSDEFPNGCRIFYRAYYSDQVVEIYPQTRIPGLADRLNNVGCEIVGNADGKAFVDTPFVPVQIKVSSFPEYTEGRAYPGLHILGNIATLDGRNLKIQPFVPGSRAEIQRTLDTVYADAKDLNDPVQKGKWREWAATAPKDDNAHKHMRLLYVPFRHALFGAPAEVQSIPPIEASSSERLVYSDLLDMSKGGLTGATQPAVLWSGASIPEHEIEPRYLDENPALSSRKINRPPARKQRADNAIRKRKQLVGWAQFTQNELLNYGLTKFTREELDANAKLVLGTTTGSYRGLTKDARIKVLEQLGGKPEDCRVLVDDEVKGGDEEEEDEIEDDEEISKAKRARVSDNEQSLPLDKDI